MIPPIRVLVVDDSAFARKVMREVLSSDAALEVVGIARDGLEALEKIVELRPDVITLDLIMPDLDGLGVLRALKQTSSPKVVIVSVSGSETELALEALENGAVDVVAKPTPFATDRLYSLSADLIAAVKTAAAAKVPTPSTSEARAKLDDVAFKARSPGSAQLVVIGTSTGGPQALAEIFKLLPEHFPVPIAVALHIPAGYTAPLAARISQASAVKLTEAVDGQELIAGEAVIAPGGMHLSIRAVGEKFYALVSREPTASLYHPSVDILFTSAARAAGRGTLALILTGMGSDGLLGSEEITKAGGRVLAESEISCVVFGMSRCVIEAKLAAGEASLQKIPQMLVDNL